jgi:hypothetical protein
MQANLFGDAVDTGEYPMRSMLMWIMPLRQADLTAVGELNR